MGNNTFKQNKESFIKSVKRASKGILEKAVPPICCGYRMWPVDSVTIYWKCPTCGATWGKM